MAKTLIKNYVFKPGIGAADNRYPAAYSLLDANKLFIQKEAVTWIQDQVAAGALGFVGYTYNQAKCERDIGYVIDAYLYDLRYGGNEKLRNTIKYYWDQAVAQVDGDRQPEIQTHAFIGTLIKNYILTNIVYPASNIEINQTIDVSKTVANLQFNPTAAIYTPSTGSMVLTIGTHSLSVGDEIFIAPNGLVFICAFDNNATEHPYPRGSGVPNATGKDPSYYAPITITAVGSTTVTVNVGVSSNTSQYTFVRSEVNAVTSGAVTKINTLAFNTVDVIANGLAAMPTAVATGVGTIKVQGRYDTENLLLITNTTKNEIIYSFNNPATGGSAVLKTDSVIADPDFASYLQATDTLTTITLNYSTVMHSVTDDLQIFVEKTENGKSITTVRPYDFGTDSIERMRVAQPQSMLDADFEYGLQPTKWAAIGALRGYPSVYEIPGTDTAVVSVITDASTGTDGIGQSLITVTTVSPHGLVVGSPITIKALEDSVVGAARAEGSFVIDRITSPSTFTYFAKSKVGTVAGGVLSTTYTQLRQAGFYTGASIGNPDITVLNNGFAGTLVAELDVPSGETRIPFDGPSPSIGAPLTSIRIPVGSQVTGVIDTSAGGGEYITPLIEGDYPVGSTVIELSSALGVVVNLAADSGDQTATYIESINTNALTFSNAFTVPVIGNTTVYPNVSGTVVNSIGAGVIFDISRAAGVYTVDSIVDAGQDYQIGDRILILATQLGGVSPDHDLVLIVETLGIDNAIASVAIEGIAFDGTYTFENLTPNTQGGSGIGAQFNVTYTGGIFTNVTASVAGSNYSVNDRIVISGSAFGPLGLLITNDLVISVTGVDGTGSLDTFTFAGTAPTAQVSYVNPAYSTSGSGVGVEFTVTRTGTQYSVVISPAVDGSGFAPFDTITVLGTALGGTSPTNDLVITVDTVDNGAIVEVSPAGTAVNTDTKTNVLSQNLIGAGLDITVALAAGVYSATVNFGGLNYAANQTIFISGDQLVGSTPTNDLTLTITAVDAIGSVQTLSAAGIAASGTASYVAVVGLNEAVTGTNARFNILRTTSVYTTTINLAGTNYKVGNKFLISGTTLGGDTPINDLLLRVTTVSESGSILNFIQVYSEAARGTDLVLYSVVVVSDATSGLLQKNDTIEYSALATLEIIFDSAHGLVPGNTFIVTTGSDNGDNNHALAAGSFFATEIPSTSTLRYQARTAGAISTDLGQIQADVYPRPDSFFIHRPYDGGVQLGTGGPQHGAQAIRQSKKYIRYQSGKGIMYTTGALFAPSYDLRSVTSDGVELNSLITIVTDDNDHGVQIGGVIRLLGIETPGYNSGPETASPPEFDYTVTNVLDERTFQIRAQRRLGATTAILGFGSQMSVVSWHGATVRSGIFDDQNGIFWEFDGTQISVAQRTGTRQLAGTIALTVDNNVVTGTNTKFRDQLKAGDRIIIKGMTHVVSHVDSQTACTVTPDWRGVVDITGAKANLIVDKKVKQADFNLDRLDGTGPSGYNIDIAKMQMIGIQYSWYGAGFIDFMLRGADGNFVFAHRMRNSNVNTEAFMRSGNLPVRYEVANEGPSGKLKQAMDGVQVFIELEDVSFFPTQGYVYIDNEIMLFTGKDNLTNRLTGVTRAATFTNFQAGAARSYTAGAATGHTARTGVILISQTITPLISHWGSAFITDGLFDEDRGYLFSYAETNVEITTIKQTAFLIRLSPSVSNALVGDLGERELLNRAQLLLQGLEITSDETDSSNATIKGGIVIEGVLNPQNYPIDPSNIGWSGLSGVAQGGQPSFAQIASGGSVNFSTGDTPVVANITAQADINATATVAFGRNNTNIIDVGVDSWNDSNALVGDFVTASSGGANLGSGIAIQAIGGPFRLQFSSVLFFRLTLASSYSGTTSGDITVQRRLTTVNRNFGSFTKLSVDTAGVTVGTAVTGGTVTFPANTQVNTIQPRVFGTTEYFEIQFNNSYTGTLTAGTGTVELTFSQPPFAQPGETIFSFIAVPGERATLDLSDLKELTNTPLGGRGTYPNGPDVLAINVFKVSGAALPANIILRWSEAQA